MRDVAIPYFVVPILEEYVRQHVGEGPDALIFTARRGGILHASVLDRHRVVVREKVGLGDSHIHDLRYTALTWAARPGATLSRADGDCRPQEPNDRAAVPEHR